MVNTDTDGPRRRRPGAFVALMLLGLATGLRAIEHMRTVDFLLVFAAGAMFGAGLAGLIAAFRARKRNGASRHHTA